MREIIGVALIVSWLSLNFVPESIAEAPKKPYAETSVDRNNNGIIRFVNPTTMPMGCMVIGDSYRLPILVQPRTISVWYYKPNNMRYACRPIPS